MKKYTKPQIEKTELTTSPGTETPREEADGGIWDLDL